MPAPADLLLALLGHDPPGRATLAALPPAAWTALHAAACQHGVPALLWHRLLEDDAASLAPAPVREQLATLHLLSSLRAEARRRQLAEALAALRVAGVAVVPLKGAFLAEHAYAAPALRPMGDLDLLVPRGAAAAAIEALVACGYARPDARSHAEYAEHRHLPPLRRPGALTIELHPVIEPCAPPFALSLASVWRRTRPTVAAGEPARALAPEDLLLHLATHMGRSHLLGASVVSVLDVARWLERFGAKADWDALARRAVESGTRRFVYAALRLAQVALGAPVGGDALRALHDDADDVAVAQADGVVRWPRGFPADALLLVHPRSEPWAWTRRLGRELVVDPLLTWRRGDAAAATSLPASARWSAAARFLLDGESRRAYRQHATRVRHLRRWALAD